MATTGFWPVKGRLKEVLAYAKNPDKTTDAKYLDDDLRAAIDYAENSSKTDEQMYVSGINCSKHRAYEEMCAVKRKFHESGKVIAYHAYQSFEAGEVTPEEAHEIGKKTARNTATKSATIWNCAKCPMPFAENMENPFWRTHRFTAVKRKTIGLNKAGSFLTEKCCAKILRMR